MTPRIAPVASVSEEQATVLAKTPRRPDGRPLNLFATLAHRPALMARVNALGGYFATRALLDERARELVVVRTAGTLRCDYELYHHRAAGERAGLTAAEVAAAEDPSRSYEWDPADLALLDVVDELLARHAVSDCRWAALLDTLDDDCCLEVLLLTGFYAMLAGTANAIGVEPDDA